MVMLHMSALHYRADYWIERGVFDGLHSFSEFESRVNDIHDEKDRGDVFEIFIEGYLETQAITMKKQQPRHRQTNYLAERPNHWAVGADGIAACGRCGRSGRKI